MIVDKRKDDFKLTKFYNECISLILQRYTYVTKT